MELNLVNPSFYLHNISPLFMSPPSAHIADAVSFEQGVDQRPDDQTVWQMTAPEFGFHIIELTYLNALVTSER